MEAVFEIIEVNNQTTIQIVIIVGNLGTWQKIVTKENMMHEIENCKKGIMHQLAIKMTNNCL
jgi:hypothetical protein